MFDLKQVYVGKPPDGTGTFGIPQVLTTVTLTRTIKITSIVVAHTGDPGEAIGVWLNLAIGTGAEGTNPVLWKARSFGWNVGPFTPRATGNDVEILDSGDVTLNAGQSLCAVQFRHDAVATQYLTLTVSGLEYQL